MTRILSPPRPAPTELPDVAWMHSSKGQPRVVHPTVEELLTTPEARERFEKTLAALAAGRIRRQPEPPLGLDEFEQRVMASPAFRTVLADRAFIRALLRYVRRLERDVAEMGEFW